MNLNMLANLTLVSLDQCFLSRLAINRKRDGDFEHLLNVLLSAVRDKRVLCPAHELETKYESIKFNDPAHARTVVRLQNSLSLGHAFQTFYDVVAGRMLELVRPSFRFPAYRYKPVHLGCAAELALRRERLAVMDRRCEETINGMPYPPKNHKKGTPFPDLLTDIEREREDSMRVLLTRMATGPTAAPPVDVRPDWIRGVHRYLMQARVTPGESHALIRAVDGGQVRRLDVLRVHSTLFAKLEQDMLDGGRKWHLQDHADIYRLSVALLYADLATCDKPMRDLLRQTKLDSSCRARVFSVTQPRDFAMYIRSLPGPSSNAHSEAAPQHNGTAAF